MIVFYWLLPVKSVCLPAIYFGCWVIWFYFSTSVRSLFSSRLLFVFTVFVDDELQPSVSSNLQLYPPNFNEIYCTMPLFSVSNFTKAVFVFQCLQACFPTVLFSVLDLVVADFVRVSPSLCLPASIFPAIIFESWFNGTSLEVLAIVPRHHLIVGWACQFYFEDSIAPLELVAYTTLTLSLVFSRPQRASWFFHQTTLPDA